MSLVWLAEAGAGSLYVRAFAQAGSGRPWLGPGALVNLSIAADANFAEVH